MMRLVALGALGASLLHASPSLAATRYVDDDRAECPRAAFTSVQAAVDASGAGDVVRVCSGSYGEQIVLPADKPRLVLRGVPPRGPRLVGPSTGIARHSAIRTPSKPWFALVRLDGSRQRIEGFTIETPLPVTDPVPDHFYPCQPVAAIELQGDRSAALGNRIAELTTGACPHGHGQRRTVGIRVSAEFGGLAGGNEVKGADTGISFADNDGGAAQRNILAGTRAGVAMPETTYEDYAIDVTIRANDAFGNGAGVVSAGSGRITGNDLHDNGTGIVLDDASSADVDRNFVRGNHMGIHAPVIGSHGLGRWGHITRNQVRDNTGDGIHIGGCAPRCFPASSDFWVVHNTALGNAKYDCYDDGTDSLWRRNIGVKDFPTDICLPPN